jgi:hypothetical protein
MTPAHKEWIFYGAAMLAALLVELGGALALLPVLFAVWRVWVWAFDVK